LSDANIHHLRTKVNFVSLELHQTKVCRVSVEGINPPNYGKATNKKRFFYCWKIYERFV